MMIIAAIGYLRVIVAGVASAVWRTLLDRECPCEFCRAHREFCRTSSPLSASWHTGDDQ